MVGVVLVQYKIQDIPCIPILHIINLLIEVDDITRLTQAILKIKTVHNPRSLTSHNASLVLEISIIFT